MKYRALITDLDGTAIRKSSDGSDIDSDLIVAIARAKNAGVKITCATGREWRLVEPITKILGIEEPCIVEGGTRIVDPKSGETLWSQPIEHKSTRKILELFEAHNDSGMLSYSDDVMAIDFTQVNLGDIDHANFLYLLGLPVSNAERLANELNLLEEDFVAHITPSWKGRGYDDVHVTHRLADKEHAAKQWQSMVGVTEAETAGMGDSGNDLPIFNAVELKIAVGNATADLKTASDYIAPSEADGALEHVLREFFGEG